MSKKYKVEYEKYVSNGNNSYIERKEKVFDDLGCATSFITSIQAGHYNSWGVTLSDACLIEY